MIMLIVNKGEKIIMDFSLELWMNGNTKMVNN